MARFFGAVGFSGGTVEGPPGVWKQGIVERSYYGDIIRNNRRMDDSQSVNPNISVNNSISIVADPYANENFIAIRYVRWMNKLWTVTNVEVQRPRLILELGGVYNGPKV